MFFMDYIFNGTRRDIFNGYTTQSISKLKNIILFYIERYNGVFFTMMNKLLFYTEDLFSYKMTSKGMNSLSQEKNPHCLKKLHKIHDHLHQALALKNWPLMPLCHFQWCKKSAHLLHLGVSGTSHDAAPHYTLLWCQLHKWVQNHHPHVDRFARMILHHQHQVALNWVQPWSNITTKSWKDLLFDNSFLQFLRPVGSKRQSRALLPVGALL